MIDYTLKPYQEEGVGYLLHHHYAILGDSMGLGKTLQAIEVAKRTGRRTLVVCPASLRETWAEEIKTFSDLTPILMSNDSYLPKEEEVAIIGYGALKNCKGLFKNTELVIADEVHYLKNINAKRTCYFHDYLAEYTPDRFIGLTGTAIKNRVGEFFSLLALCSYNPHGSSGKNILDDFNFYSFCEKFSVVKRMKMRGRVITSYEGHKNVDLLRTYLKNKYIRRKASQVLDIPPITRKDILFNATAVDEELLAAWNERGKVFATKKKNSAKIKAPLTANYCKELLEAGEGPLVIYSDHVEPVEEIAKLLSKYNIKVITGSTPMQERDITRRLFQEGKIGGIAATVGAMSTGYTLTASRNMIFNDLPFVPGDLAQCEKRIHRIGQESKCVIHRIFYGKVDVMIAKTLDKKIKTLKEVL